MAEFPQFYPQYTRTHPTVAIADPMDIDQEEAPLLVMSKEQLVQETTITFEPSDEPNPVTFNLGLDLDFEVHEEDPTIIDWSSHALGHITTDPLAAEMVDTTGAIDADQLNSMFESVSDNEANQDSGSNSDGDIYGINDLFERTGAPRHPRRHVVTSDGDGEEDSGDEYAWYNRAYGRHHTTSYYQSAYSDHSNSVRNYWTNLYNNKKKTEPKVEIYEVTDTSPLLTVSKVMHSNASLHKATTPIIVV